MKRASLAFAAAAGLAASLHAQPDLVARARAIHQRIITLDTHNDIDPRNFTADCNYTMRLTTQVNLPKMKEGGVDVSFFIAISISSSMLRLTLANLRMPEWDAMTGAFDRPIACIIDPFDGCETSTMIPHLFISWITCRPSGDRPPQRQTLSASPVFESDS